MTEEYSADALLADYFEDIYFELHKKGVPDSRMPTPECILSMIMDKFLMEDELGDWITDYAEIHYDPLTSEYIEAIDNGIGTLKSPQKRRPRPEWLKVLDSPPEEVAPAVRVPSKETEKPVDNEDPVE